MELEKIIALCNAGFTKDEILILCNPTTPNTENEPKEGALIKEETTPKIDNKQTIEREENPLPQSKEETKVESAGLSNEQFNKLLQALNVGNASIDVPKPVSLDDVMAEHFKDVMLGK